ncbi:MAG: hypothetical protein RJA07_2809 [Bacteroidota bacterium]
MKKINVLIFLFLAFKITKAQDLQQMAKAKPFDVHGNLSIQTQVYSIDGAAARQPWNSYIISGAPTISIYGFQLPFTFLFSNNQRDFRQPFNQIGVSPQYKWLKLHAGYRSISFSQFGMAGHVILGGGVELNPGKFRFGVLYGRSNKAVAEDTTKNISQNLNSINYPAYKQMLFATKIGIGTASNFFDLYVVKGKDDVSSLPNKPVKTEVLPAENLVIGVMHKFSFFKKKLEWQSEAAGSAFTRDVTAPSFDLSSVKNVDLISKVMTPNLSTVLYTAIESQLKYKHKYFTTGLKCRRIEPDYKSMGAYFFQTDLQQFTGNFSTRLFKNKLSFNGSMGIQSDNVAKKKLATTQRNIYSAAANYQLNQHFGVDVNFSNYGTAQKSGTKTLSDTSKINQISNSFTIAPHYMFQQKNLAHNFFLIIGNQSLNDRNKFTSNYTEMNMLFSNFNYSLMNIDKKINYNFGLNYSRSSTSESKIELQGATVGLGKTWLKDKMNTDFSLNVNSTKFNSEANGFTTTASLGSNYSLSKKHSFRMQLNWLINNSKNAAAGNSFNEFTAMVQYRFNF